MNTLDENRLKAEFDANLDLWKHEETLRQQRNTVLLSINAFLAVGVSAMISVGPPVMAAVGIAVGIALFGLGSCFIWERIQARHVIYAKFRRMQLRELAAKLGYESWENQWVALRTVPPPEKVTFAVTEDSYKPPTKSYSAIDAESHLSQVIAGIWAVLAIGCLTVSVCHFI